MRRTQPHNDAVTEQDRGPSVAAVCAAIRLLDDSDDNVVRACRDQLLSWGEVARAPLLQAAEDADPNLRLRVRAVLRALELRSWVARSVRSCADLPATGNIGIESLLSVCAQIANLNRPDRTSVAELQTMVTALAEEVGARIDGRAEVTRGRAFASMMANQLGFRGVEQQARDLRAGQLDEVLRRRRGTSEDLCLAYLLVGRSAGLRLTGVLLPEHALVRVHTERPILLDPFHDGRCVTKADCVRYLRHHGHGLHTTSYLEDVDDVQILAAMLRRLHSVHGYREDHDTCAALDAVRNSLLG